MEFIRKYGIFALIVIGLLMLAAIIINFYSSFKNYFMQNTMDAGIYLVMTAVIVLFGIAMCFKDKISDKILDWQIKKGKKKKK